MVIHSDRLTAANPEERKQYIYLIIKSMVFNEPRAKTEFNAKCK
jgi:hypothetical protein